MKSMSHRERIMTALRNQQPDRIPATPDISIMIPTRLTGEPFWRVEFHEKPSLTQAYIRAARYFDLDGWMFNGTLKFQSKSEFWYEDKVLRHDEDRWEVVTILHTPDGDLSQLTVYPKENPSTVVRKYVKDLKNDFKKLKHLYSDVVSCDASIYRQQKQEMGEQGMICCYIAPPGFQNWIVHFDGNLEAMTYAYYDDPEVFEELAALYDRVAMQQLELALEAGIESVLTGGSGSITLQSPALFRKLSLPTIQKITKMCRQAGVISGIHSCGKERYVVEACANETDLDYINPLEAPPMGDCDLAECKAKFGHKLALMGNLHTTQVMLLGTVEQVRLAALQAILAAGANGGFVLSTGDQCGRDTPFENIREIVRVAKEFGTYPLDVDRIHEEINRIDDKNRLISVDPKNKGKRDMG